MITNYFIGYVIIIQHISVVLAIDSGFMQLRELYHKSEEL